jgi:beta-glucosidase
MYIKPAISKNTFSFLIAACLFVGASFGQAKTGSQFPFQNTSLPFEARVDNLLSQLKLEEKVAQMLNSAPAIPRLGIPAYDWWNEVLHGVCPYALQGYCLSSGNSNGCDL